MARYVPQMDFSPRREVQRLLGALLAGTTLGFVTVLSAPWLTVRRRLTFPGGGWGESATAFGAAAAVVLLLAAVPLLVRAHRRRAPASAMLGVQAETASLWIGFGAGLFGAASFAAPANGAGGLATLWLLAVLWLACAASAAALLWLVQQRWPPAPGECCPACGYDLHASLSDTCPECGAAQPGNGAGR